MNVNANSKLQRVFLELVDFSLFGRKKTDEENIKYACDNIAELYAFAEKHDLAHIVAYAVEKLGIKVADAEIKKKLKKQMLVSAVRYERLKYELESLCAHFEQEKIYHIPLKGAVVRDHYPEPWMRTSCDVDILVHEEDLERTVYTMVHDLGFEQREKSTHDVSLFSPGRVNVEIHFTLVEDDRINDVDKVLCKVWDYAGACEGFEYKMQLCDEMFYFYHVAHMAKHFQIGGCGIKPFVDHKILNEKLSFDEKKIEKLLEVGNLERFEEAVTNLCNVWFSDGEYTPLLINMERYVFYGGVYGNADNRFEVEQIRHGGKFRYLMYKLWLPYNKIKSIYPVLEKQKWLILICQVRRWIRLLVGGRFKRSKKKMEIIGTQSNEKVAKTLDMMNRLGLEIK